MLTNSLRITFGKVLVVGEIIAVTAKFCICARKWYHVEADNRVLQSCAFATVVCSHESVSAYHM